MKSFAFLCITLLGVSGMGYVGYEFLRPKNIQQYLQWQGYKLLSNNENAWEAIYQENKDIFSSVKDLRTYCSKILNSTNFEELKSVVKYCVDEVDTVRGYFIKEGLIDTLISKVEDYQIALVLRSGNKEFLEIVDSVDKYKEWCESNLNKKPSIATVINVKTFCTPKPYRNASEKLEYEGFKRLNKEQLRAKYQELQINKLANNEGIQLLHDIWGKEDWINLKKDKDPNHEKFVKAYAEWCDKEANRLLLEKDFYPSGYFKFKTRCADIGELKTNLKRIEEIKKNNPLVQEVSNFEEENVCEIYFVHNEAENIKHRAEDPFWIELRKEYWYRNRDFYKEFKDFIARDSTKELCKEANGKRVLVKYDYWKSEWM